MEDDLSDAELDVIDSLAAGALSAPWEAFVEGRDHFGGDNFIRTGGLDDAAPDMYVSLSYWNSDPPKPADASVLDFIATSRQFVPRIVHELRRRRVDRTSIALEPSTGSTTRQLPWPERYSIGITVAAGPTVTYTALSFLGAGKAIALACAEHARRWSERPVYDVRVTPLGSAPKSPDGIVVVGDDLHDRMEF